jgi:hypothetical protein
MGMWTLALVAETIAVERERCPFFTPDHSGYPSIRSVAWQYSEVISNAVLVRQPGSFYRLGQFGTAKSVLCV